MTTNLTNTQSQSNFDGAEAQNHVLTSSNLAMVQMGDYLVRMYDMHFEPAEKSADHYW